MIALRTDLEIRQYRVANPAAGVDQERGAAYAYSQGPVDPVHFDDGLLFIRQQDKRQLVFGFELGMRFGALRADADDP
jgi:hypothetical protein